MPLARWQATIVDPSGNVVPLVFVEVRREIAGAPLASLYSDRDGASGIGNPFEADTEGFAAFHVAGGAYKIRAYAAGFERIWRYAAIGTGAETDFGTVFSPQGAWLVGTTYATGHLVSHDGGGDPYAFVSNDDGNLGHEPQFDTGVGISDTYWTVLGLIELPGAPGAAGSSDVVGTSASSVAIGTGTKTFTIVESDRGWAVGARLRLSSTANPATHWMEGVVTAYSGVTLQISSDAVAGSGSRGDWTINLAGEPGQDGAGNPIYFASSVSGTNTVAANTDGMPAPSATKRLVLITFANTCSGAMTIAFDAGSALDLKIHGNAIESGEVVAGIPYLLAVTSTDVQIIFSGLTI